MRLVLTIDQLAQHVQFADVAALLCIQQESCDLWRFRLAVAVDAAVALLNTDQRPRNVVVHQVVAQSVEVYALRRHVACDQDAEFGIGALEFVDKPHLLLVRQPTVHDLHGARWHLQVLGQVLLEPMQRGHTLGKHHRAGLLAFAHADVLQVVHQRGVLVGVLTRDLCVECLEALEGLALVRVRLGDALETVLNRLTQRGRGGEERLDQRPREQTVLRRIGVGGFWVDPGLLQLCGHGVLLCGRLHRAVDGVLALRPFLANHTGHLVAMTVATDEKTGDGLGVDRAVGHHGGRIQQTQDLLETLRVTIVRCCRGQQERLRRRRERASELVVLRAHVGGVMDLVDHHRIPTHLLQHRAILTALQRVHRDDHARKIRKRIPARRQDPLHPLNTGRVQPDQRDSKTRPHLLLELLHDVLRGDDENAFATPAADQLREDHADLERLAQAHGIGDEDTWTQVVVAKRLAHCRKLIVEWIHQHALRHREAILVERYRRLTQRGLEPQARRAVTGGVVGDDLYLGGIEHLHVVERGVETCRGVTDVIRQATDLE